ncbi:peptidylprolyl isomerase [Patescibacteria group bacterium]|nr:peptidylprolyl isomerase [Patescibacteria group bacterium]MBU4458794.1 peptidylprolyl isomerase [Patescibacteria group bacterium]
MLIIGIALIVLVIVVVAIFYFISLNKSSKIIKVTIQIEKGSIELELYRKAAPNTVDNFIKLAEQGFYDGVRFHRVVEDFMIQSGDPGTGGPGYTFEDEINPKALGLSDELIVQLQSQGYTFNFLLKSIPHKVGTISMANSGPNTNGSQFFIITTKDQPDLDGRYTAFGQVISGMDVVQEIEQGDIINKIIIN